MTEVCFFTCVYFTAIPTKCSARGALAFFVEIPTFSFFDFSPKNPKFWVRVRFFASFGIFFSEIHPPTTTYSGVPSKIRVFSRVFSIPYHYILWCACFLEYSESSDNQEMLLFFGKGNFRNFRERENFRFSREREPLIAKKLEIRAFSAVGSPSVIVTTVVTNGWNR